MTKDNLLSDDNICGRNLLQLVSRGTALVAELLRLCDHVPEELTQTDATSYLFDFGYFERPEHFEAVLCEDQVAIEKDELFRENHAALVDRYYRLFSSIVDYFNDYNRFVEDVTSGFYVQYNAEALFSDVNGKQLLIEALYLYGVVLFVLHRDLPTVARERLVVSCYRYKSSMEVANLDTVVRLCRGSGPMDAIPPSPQMDELFSRFPVNAQVARMAITRLQMDDIYGQLRSFPAPEHRSTGLGGQASMLFVILFFVPTYLQSKRSTMREIVDKFFHDNWIIPLYLIRHVDLEQEWAPYGAASSALKVAVTLTMVKEEQAANKRRIEQCVFAITALLRRGILTDNYITDHIGEILNCIRDANASLRWILLHRTTTKTEFKQLLVSDGVDAEEIVQLLLSTAKLEHIVKSRLGEMLQKRLETWESAKSRGASYMAELSNYFSGEVALAHVQRDEQLMEYFERVQREIEGLDHHEPTVAGRRIQTLINALVQIEHFDEVDTNPNIKRLLEKTRKRLKQMVKVMNLKDSMLTTIDLVSDISYGMTIVRAYTPILQQRIQNDPRSVSMMRYLFLKVASVLDIPLVRITQANSEDTISVANYYSLQLVDYVQKVLEVIPQTMFKVLDDAIKLQSDELRPLPLKVETSRVHEFVKSDLRLELARKTHLVSMFARGITQMESTLLGVIEVHPRKILERGVRKELVRQITGLMTTHLGGDVVKSAQELEERMGRLRTELHGLKRSFEYIQDFIHMNSLKVWHEVYARVVFFLTEQQCNCYTKRKVLPSKSKYHNRDEPIPPVTCNFMGILEGHLLSITRPGFAFYSPGLSTWYHLDGRVAVRPHLLLGSLPDVISPTGLRGLDILMSHRIADRVKAVFHLYQRDTGSWMPLLQQAAGEFSAPWKLPEGTKQLFDQLQQSGGAWCDSARPLVLQIGQAALLRRQFNSAMRLVVNAESAVLSNLAATVNSAVLGDISNKDSALGAGSVAKLSSTMSFCGQDDIAAKVYVPARDLAMERLPLVLAVLAIAAFPKLQVSELLGSLVGQGGKSGNVDGAPLALGIVVLLKQEMSHRVSQFLEFMGRYCRAVAVSDGKKSSKHREWKKAEISKCLMFARLVSDFARCEWVTVREHFPVTFV